MRSKPFNISFFTYWKKLTHRSPSYLLFWVKHRIGQHFLDPVWLSRLNSEIQKGNIPIKGLASTRKFCSSDAKEILALLGKHANKDFFFGENDRGTLFLEYNKRFPENAFRLIEEANDLTQNKYHYAGETFEIGNPPDWYIPHTILFNYLYHNSFEAFHWLRVLGKAYWLTNDIAYADHAKKWLNLWLDTIPNHFHSDFWKDTCFTGVRALNLFSSLIFFSDVWCDDPQIIQKLLGQIYLHGTLLERRLEYPGANHIIWQAHDLALLGLALEPVFDGAKAWQIKALKILEIQVNRQYYSDGINFELSIGYQVFVTKLVGEVISTFWKAGKALPPHIIWRFKQAVNAVEILSRPDSKLPLYGDSYRSQDPNLESSIDEAVPLLLGLNDRLFPEKNQGLKYDSPLLPWLMGNSYIWDNANIIQNKSFLHCAPESGVAVLKESTGEISESNLYVCVQAGKSEQGKVHAHADTLSVELADNYGSILIDPGAYVEKSDPLRTYFRSTLAHNTVRIDFQDISKVSDTFFLWPSTCGKITGCYQNNDVVAVEAHHTSYQRLRSRALHERVVLLWRSKNLIILDKLTGNGPFFVERMFHFSPGELCKVDDLWQWRANGRSWNMFNNSTKTLKEEIAIGCETPPLGWSAEYRGKKVYSPTLRQSGIVVDVLRCLTVFTSDLSVQVKAIIIPSAPDLEQIGHTLKFNIGNLNIKQFREECKFIWQ